MRLLARRPGLAAALTVVALVELLLFRPSAKPVRHHAQVVAHGRRPLAKSRVPRRTPRPTPTLTPTPTPTTTRAVRRRRVVVTPTPTPAPTQRPSPKPAPTHTYTGDAVDMEYGTVQVQITVRGTRITDVEALQLPDSSRQSRQINDYAAPQLRQEALDAQSANIDTVSGATYTSDAYRESLQSAIDQWKPS